MVGAEGGHGTRVRRGVGVVGSCAGRVDGGEFERRGGDLVAEYGFGHGGAA